MPRKVKTAAVAWGFLPHRHPSAFLLAAQLLSLVLYPLLEGRPFAPQILGAFGVVVLALVVWVIRRSATVRWTTWVLTAPAFLLTLLAVFFGDRNLLVWASVVEALVYFYAAGTLIAYMMEDSLVTTDELFAAGATFTLLGWGFAYAFVACHVALPGSFVGDAHITQPLAFLEFLTLSFNNLSATGLGDIVPANSTARVLVMLEQFCGVAYIAVVVSRLIGMTIVRSR